MKNNDDVNDDACVQRLRHVVAGDGDVDLTPVPPSSCAQPARRTSSRLKALHAMEGCLSALEADLAELRRHHEALVANLAKAVIERLDARWSRSVDDV